MEHCIHVFIAKSEVLKSITAQFPSAHVVPLAQGFAMVPLTEEFYDEIPESDDQQFLPDADNFELLGPKISALGLSISKNGPVVYCETDYSEETGTQRAVAWNQKQVCFPPTHSTVEGRLSPEKISNEPINVALRAIGVSKSSTSDEFATLQLGKYGNDLDWIEQPKNEG
jgi:hypothetical protein